MKPYKPRKTDPFGPRRPPQLARFQFAHPGYYTVHDCLCDYSRERLIAKGKPCTRAWFGFNLFMEVVPPHQAAEKLTTGQVEDYVDLRVSHGCSLLTPRRELAFIKAAFGYAHRRNRIPLLPYIELPEGQSTFRRPLTEAEFKLVMRQPMSARLRRFYVCARYTGHRSQALEQWTWDRCDLERRVADFNVPGMLLTNKRRCKDFPIIDEFYERLVAWKALATDRFVIGAGGSTYPEAAHVVRELAKLTDPTLVPRHCMRKMFATELFERDVNAEKVGHLMADSPVTLRKNYVAMKHSTLLDAAAALTRPRA